jgi:hypothetical protein
MNENRGRDWDQARIELIRRWQDVLAQIEARDEGGVLALSQEMDEFCDLALAGRERAREALQRESAPAPGETRCLFCRGFTEAGGCLGALQALNHAVLAGLWEDARDIGERYIHRLQTMELAGTAAPARS